MIKIYRTVNRKQEYWQEKPSIELSEKYLSDTITVAINSKQEYQTHLGFGGAFTEAAAFTLFEAGEEAWDEVLKAYFSKSGLDYNLGRVSIHSNDFSLNSYTYIQENDLKLETFTIKHEEKWVIPMILDAMKIAGKEIMMFASCWSPPGFMKTNQEMCYAGRLKEEYQEAWANYYVKFIQEMQKRNIKIDALSVQNEPEATQIWESRYLSAHEEGSFIADYLYPALEKNGLESTKLVIWDHNRDRVVRRANTTLMNEKASKHIWGIGYHWYVSKESKNLATIHAIYPDKHLLLTECCVELVNVKPTEEQRYIGSLAHGEHYGRNIINDFNHYSEGWIDWNLLLNEAGGPNHVGNYCEAPIMYDRINKKIIYNPSYYYIGHFSKFIEPGAKRLMCFNDEERDLYSVAYKNPNGDIVVVIQNEGWVKELAVVIDGKGANVTLPDHSIITLVYSK